MEERNSDRTSDIESPVGDRGLNGRPGPHTRQGKFMGPLCGSTELDRPRQRRVSRVKPMIRKADSAVSTQRRAKLPYTTNARVCARVYARALMRAYLRPYYHL